MTRAEALGIIRSQGEIKRACLALIEDVVKEAEKRVITCKVDEVIENKHKLAGAQQVLSTVTALIERPVKSP